MVPVLDASHVYVGAWALGWRRVFETDAPSECHWHQSLGAPTQATLSAASLHAAFRSEVRSCVRVEVDVLGSRP